jgi:putative SOS response-associated peptidase YedK
MCGRFFLTASADELSLRFGADIRLNLPPRPNIAPTQPVLVVRPRESGSGREVALMRWGLVPGWAKAVGTTPLFNARVETVAEKPSFRGAFRYRRCLVPANGWYEWTVEGKQRQPYAITVEGEAPFAFAGVWELWQGAGEGSWLESVTILTQPASGVLEGLHPRMPMVLKPEAEAAWLAEPLITPAMVRDGDAFSARPVDRALNKVDPSEPAARPQTEPPRQGDLFG